METRLRREPPADVPTYIVDTHALYWYISQATQLTPAADAVFRLAEAGGARILVPAIVVAEIYFLTLKRGQPLLPSRLLHDMDNAPGWFELSELGRAQLEALERLADIPELHDRLIAAEALVFGAPVITADSLLHQAKSIKAIW